MNRCVVEKCREAKKLMAAGVFWIFVFCLFLLHTRL